MGPAARAELALTTTLDGILAPACAPAPQPTPLEAYATQDAGAKWEPIRV